MDAKERTVVVHWEGLYEWDQCIMHRKKGHVLYAIYGSHHLYGRDVLLYLGRSEDVGNRIEGHGRWIEDEYDTMRVQFASIGDFNGWAKGEKIEQCQQADPSLVPEVEALLIRAQQPAYNIMEKGSWKDA